MNKNKIESKSLIINPISNSLYFENFSVESSDTKSIVKWNISCVCASERRRFNREKSHSDLTPFVAGHESVGKIVGKDSLYMLLPHSNCLTRFEKNLCSQCQSGNYNLCSCMNHAGLAAGEPGGFSEYGEVSNSIDFASNSSKCSNARLSSTLSTVIYPVSTLSLPV